jgi:hypothetical protein
VRVLLDECVHAGLKRELREHTVKTVPEMNWRGVTNGRLLAKAAMEFDVFITTDKNIEYQQNLSELPMPVLAIQSYSLLWEDIVPFLPTILECLSKPLENKFYRLTLP